MRPKFAVRDAFFRGSYLISPKTSNTVYDNDFTIKLSNSYFGTGKIFTLQCGLLQRAGGTYRHSTTVKILRLRAATIEL